MRKFIVSLATSADGFIARQDGGYDFLVMGRKSYLPGMGAGMWGKKKIGEGISLLSPRHRTIKLQLVEARSWEDGVVTLHYSLGTRD